ncbi:helix-turn-helix domain-containing protein [Pelagovum pacificum]|uniref:Helix-turn-helix domain-containing protein n=1 Tax=Pelagovum pacificum TaxID=2588711 RepID=A0A5C5G927_9RHOB|nr:helix-turn-helix domain-containing protein [Pelagovum pacificum]
MTSGTSASRGLDPSNRQLKERDLAERWQVSRRTLQRWRSGGNGPPFLIIRGCMRYRLDDIIEFENRHRQEGEE